MLKIRTHSLSWLLLALIALRGLVPAGYMIDASQNGVSLVVCDSGIYKDSAGSHHQHHHDQGSSRHDHSVCPFAVAATGAPTPSGYISFVVPIESDSRFAPSRIAAVEPNAPVFANTIRGPPNAPQV